LGTPIKQNGDPGINGAANYTINTYTEVVRLYTEADGKNLGEMTVKLKEATEERARKKVEAYLDSKVQTHEAEAEQRPERVEGQAALPIEVPEPAVTSGGAAYANL
jgi:hypothetical protein